jgi:hypothetical protein
MPPPPPLVRGGGNTRLRERGCEGPNSDEGTDTVSVHGTLGIYSMYFEAVYDILLLKVSNFRRLRYLRVTKYNIFKRWMLVSLLGLAANH